MIDITISSSGDFVVDNDGDLQSTGTPEPSSEELATVVAQMAYMAIKTDRGDYVLHGNLGNDLKKIIGLPNKPKTANAGSGAIKSAIKEWGVNYPIEVESWPEEQNIIAYEVSIPVGNPKRWVKLTLSQILDDAGLAEHV